MNFLLNQAEAIGIDLQQSSVSTKPDEAALWRRCVSWGVNPMPERLIAVDVTLGTVVGAVYYDLRPKAFLSALAVLPGFRGKGIGKLLICAAVIHMQNSGCSNVH